MSLRTISSVVFAGLLPVLGILLSAEAKNSLSEEELDQTNAGGVELRIIGEDTTITQLTDPALFVNELFGQNEVVTRVVVEILMGMHTHFSQTNDIKQTRETEDLADLTNADNDVSLVLEGGQTDLAVKTVVNNVFGRNQVDTAVNLTIVVPAGQVGSSSISYTNSFAGSGNSPGGRAPGGLSSAPALLSSPTALGVSSSGSAAPSTAVPTRTVPAVTATPVATTPTVSNTPAPAPTAQPAFQQPTSLGGAVTLMQGLSQQNPAAAPHLQSGINTVQQFQ